MISIVQADCIEFLQQLPEASVDLVFGSPPYEECRLYLEDGVNMGISRKTDAWVQWMADVHEAAQRACKGLVAFVVAGQTRNYRWSAGPALLMAELHRRGMNLRNPPIFCRVGIPGSGGPDWLRADYEWIICTTRPGKLPWSNNTACGHPPKYAPGGEMSYRNAEGRRKNERDHQNAKNRRRDAHKGIEHQPNGNVKGDHDRLLNLTRANPGNIIKAIVGGGVMGDPLCHENEAPFPADLAKFFVLSFCPPGGTVCDVFSGSGTTAAVAKEHGRNFIGCDLRQSQVDLSLRRVAAVTPDMFAEAT